MSLGTQHTCVHAEVLSLASYGCYLSWETCILMEGMEWIAEPVLHMHMRLIWRTLGRTSIPSPSPQVPRCCRMMSSPRTSLGSCSSCVRATTTVGASSESVDYMWAWATTSGQVRQRRFHLYAILHGLHTDTNIRFLFCFRFPELSENSDGEHHHCQYYHQHRGLPAQAPGKGKRCVDWRRFSAFHSMTEEKPIRRVYCSCFIFRDVLGIHQWLLLVLLRERCDGWGRSEELLQSFGGCKADF